MQIVLARIDDRLIHGQVVVGWVTYTGANHIVVINDTVAKNEMQRTLLEIAVPVHLRVTICIVDEAPSKINDVEFKNDKGLLLFTNPIDVQNYSENAMHLKV